MLTVQDLPDRPDTDADLLQLVTWAADVAGVLDLPPNRWTSEASARAVETRAWVAWATGDGPPPTEPWPLQLLAAIGRGDADVAGPLAQWATSTRAAADELHPADRRGIQRAARDAAPGALEQGRSLWDALRLNVRRMAEAPPPTPTAAAAAPERSASWR